MHVYFYHLFTFNLSSFLFYCRKYQQGALLTPNQYFHFVSSTYLCKNQINHPKTTTCFSCRYFRHWAEELGFFSEVVTEMEVDIDFIVVNEALLIVYNTSHNLVIMGQWYVRQIPVMNVIFIDLQHGLELSCYQNYDLKFSYQRVQVYCCRVFQ